MIDVMDASTVRDPNPVATGRVQPRPAQFPELDLLRLALNQVDYGLVVVNVTSRAVGYANALGRDALEGAADHFGNKRYDTGLQLTQGCVAARRPANAEQLRHTLERTRSGVRGLLSLGIGDHTCAVAVVPLGVPADHSAPTPATYGAAPAITICHALLVFAKLANAASASPVPPRSTCSWT